MKQEPRQFHETQKVNKLPNDEHGPVEIKVLATTKDRNMYKIGK